MASTKAIISASYSKSLKKFYTSSRVAEKKRENMFKYLNNSVYELRKKATEIADTYNIALTDADDEKIEKTYNKFKDFFKQLEATRLLLSDLQSNKLLTFQEMNYYRAKLDELENKITTLFNFDANRDVANDVYTKYSKALKTYYTDLEKKKKKLESLIKEKNEELKKAEGNGNRLEVLELQKTIEKLKTDLKNLKKDWEEAKVLVEEYNRNKGILQKKLAESTRTVHKARYEGKRDAVETYRKWKEEQAEKMKEKAGEEVTNYITSFMYQFRS